jgi:hypothetical protein
MNFLAALLLVYMDPGSSAYSERDLSGSIQSIMESVVA